MARRAAESRRERTRWCHEVFFAMVLLPQEDFRRLARCRYRLTCRHADDDRGDHGLLTGNLEFSFPFRRVERLHGKTDDASSQALCERGQHQILCRQPAVGFHERSGELPTDDNQCARAV